MVEIKRSNPKSFETIISHLKELEGKEARAGWFSTSHYEDGTPVAYVATIQEFGAHITQYGAKAGDYSIVIPPRPFMRPTVMREKQNWLDLMASGAKAVIAGEETATSVMQKIGLLAAADIKVSITQVFAPPLKPATIAARLRRRSDRKTKGLIDKPLVDSGTMLESVTSTVEDSNAGG